MTKSSQLLFPACLRVPDLTPPTIVCTAVPVLLNKGYSEINDAKRNRSYAWPRQSQGCIKWWKNGPNMLSCVPRVTC